MNNVKFTPIDRLEKDFDRKYKKWCRFKKWRFYFNRIKRAEKIRVECLNILDQMADLIDESLALSDIRLETYYLEKSHADNNSQVLARERIAMKYREQFLFRPSLLSYYQLNFGRDNHFKRSLLADQPLYLGF